MSDFEGGLPIKTVRDNDAALKIVDGASGATATNKLTIAKVGDAIVGGTNDFGVPVFGEDANGDYQLLKLSATGNTIVEATDLDIRDLVFATDKVDVSGSEVSLDATTLAALENITVSATDLDIRDLAFATDSVDVSGSTVELGATTLAALETITVTATDLDIRDLAFATDSVDVSGSEVSLDATTLAALESITVQNGAGAAAVNIQDGGNSITVDAVALDIRPLTNADVVTVEQGTSPWVISGTVSIDETPGAEICNYQTTATVGANSTTNHDYTITSTKTFTKMKVLVGARGAVKVSVGTWDGTTFVTKAVYFQQVQNNNMMDFPMFQPLGDGTLKVRIIIENKDGQSSDVYSTLQGLEI